MKQRPNFIIRQLAQSLDIDKRSVSSDLILLEEVGYPTDVDVHQRHCVVEAEPADAPTFTEEEAKLRRQILASLPLKVLDSVFVFPVIVTGDVIGTSFYHRLGR